MNFIPEQLEKGINVEMEHTDNPDIAKKIATDHLKEHPRYYDFLEKAENEMKEDCKQKVIDFIALNPNPTDDMVHQWADENFINTEKVEEIIYELATETVQQLTTKEYLSKYIKKIY